MNSSLTRAHLAAYLSGAAVGAAALIMIVAPHVKFETRNWAAAPAPCAGRMTSTQAESLRGQVLEAEARRDWLVQGPSYYAAAKVGIVPEAVDAAAIQVADRAVQAARARFIQACA